MEHGVVGKDGQGVLIFETNAGWPSMVSATDVAKVLRDSGVRLVMLTACLSAASTNTDTFSSVAAQLILNGIDAVAAMSASFLVVSATRYVEVFYRAMATGTSVWIAQEQARQALHSDPQRHLHARHRNEVGRPVEVQDWWLPHFYQQHPLLLQPTEPPGEPRPPLLPLSSRLSEDAPDTPRYGFSGRAREMLMLERWLLQGRLVVIQGFGGIGKTALAREASDWLTRTGMFDWACFVSFEHGGGAVSLLGKLKTCLDIDESSYNPANVASALEGVRSVLKTRRVLLIADNVESILPDGEAVLEETALKELWDVLLELNTMGVGVLLTTRDVSFGDERLTPGNKVVYLLLSSLDPEDAYLLAYRLLDILKIDLKRVPYAELRDLLVQLDHHPLAISLVLPAVYDIELSAISDNFIALLPQFKDDTVTGCNRSLLASLDYSLRRLDEAQRRLLPLLTPFEGGANEQSLLMITQMSEEEWLALRSALQQAALLTLEQIHKEINVPFLHFHPVLIPFLRSFADTGDVMLHERYAMNYSEFARYLSDSDTEAPHAVRALMVRELPNLRKAVDLLLEMGDSESAARMAISLVKFLALFDYGRERDQLRQRIEEILAAPASHESDTLSWTEYEREYGLATDETMKGNWQAASTRLEKLVARIKVLPEETPLGYGSDEHYGAIELWARALMQDGQAVKAEELLREALAITDKKIIVNVNGDAQTLVAIDQILPSNRRYNRQRGVTLAELGQALIAQGQYSKAKEAFEDALMIATKQKDQRSQTIAEAHLGDLALRQGQYDEARKRLKVALKTIRTLSEPELESVSLHNLGRVAEEEENWVEADKYYRESLSMKEENEAWASAAMTCNQLAVVAERSGRPAEAEGWYKHALALDEQVQPGSYEHSRHLNNLAFLLFKGTPDPRLAEAEAYAKQALAIKEKMDASAQVWAPLGLLTAIANQQGKAEDARVYRRREREAYVAFEGNRYHDINRLGDLIFNAAAAARGDKEARTAADLLLMQLNAAKLPVAEAIERIWQGERDQDALIEDLTGQEALTVVLILEMLARYEKWEKETTEQIVTSLPRSVIEAWSRDDMAALQQVMMDLSAEEQLIVAQAINYVKEQQETNIPYALREFEPILQVTVEVFVRDASYRAKVEDMLLDLEARSVHIRNPVLRIWDGERNSAALAEGLGEREAAFVQRILQIIAERGIS